MRLLCTADLHITDKAPKYRKDEYLRTLLGKISQILNLAEELNVDAITISGDIFDSPDIPFSLFSLASNIFRTSQVPILAVPGQHDQWWHTTPLEDTPLGALRSKKFWVQSNGWFNALDHETILGMGWNETYDNFKCMNEGTVLLIHKLVTKSGKLFKNQEEGTYVQAVDLMKQFSGFKYIISGDNHESFVIKHKGQTLINPGSLMRKRKDQIHHRPRVYLIDTEKDIVEEIFLEIEPIEEVFKLDQIDSDVQKAGAKELLDVFFQSMQDSINAPDFLTTLGNIIKREINKPDFKDYINEKIELAKTRISNEEEEC